MNRTIKIGFLFPYSSIHPNMSQDIIDGFNTAIPDKFKNTFQFFPEYVHQGNTDMVKIAINKLINFNNVDVVSGIVSYKLIPEISEILANKLKLGFFFDLGECLPPLNNTLPNIFFNSFQMWQLQYALGEWSQQKFKGKGAVLMSLYDSGYHLQNSFWQGAQAAGAEEIDMHTLPFDSNNYSLPNLLEQYFEKIKNSNIDYLHAIFCGKEATTFFEVFKKSSLYNKIPLVVSPHMASDEILSQICSLNVNCISASGWNYHAVEELNQKFIKTYENSVGKKASVFAVMGYEAGLAFYDNLSNWEKNDFNKTINYFSDVFVKSPRGVRGFSMDKQVLTSTINIEEIKMSSVVSTKTILGTGKAMNFNNEVFERIHTQNVSGWKNPYLCI